MYEYEVKVFLMDSYVGTVTVEAHDENEAMNLAQYRISFGADMTENGRLKYEQEIHNH